MNFGNPNDVWNNWFGRSSYGNRPTMMMDNNTLLPALVVFGTGMVIGAGVALMMAPKPGRELRADIGKRAGQLGQTFRERLPGQQGEGREGERVDVTTGGHARY